MIFRPFSFPPAWALSCVILLVFPCLNARAASSLAPTNVEASFSKITSNSTGVAKDSPVYRVTWEDRSNGEIGFLIQARLGNSGPFTPVSRVVADSTEALFLLGELPVGSKLQFSVVAIFGSWTTPSAQFPSATLSQVVIPGDKFDAPSGLKATYTGSGQVLLEWTDNSTVEDSFVIESRKVGDANFVSVFSSTSYNYNFNTRSLVFPGTVGELREFRMRAVRAIHGSDLSALVAPSQSTANTATATTPNHFSSRNFEPATVGSPLTFTLETTSSGNRTGFTANGLPQGLSLNATSGEIAGTPTQAGTFKVAVGATYSSGSPASDFLTLRVMPPAGDPVATALPDAQSILLGGPSTLNMDEFFRDPDAGSAVRLVTTAGANSTNSTIDVLLYPDATPQTVANFLSYVDAGDYNGTVFHRTITDFIVQGGGFKPIAAPDKFVSVAARPSPVNEPGISNLRGTVAMAKIGGQPNSATTNFFFNLGDNSDNLDNQNEGFTVFGRLSESSLAAMDALAAFPTGNYSVSVDGATAQTYEDWPINDTTAPESMDTTKTIAITSATRIPALTYSLVSNSNPAAIAAELIGTGLRLRGLAAGSADIEIEATDLDGNQESRTLHITAAGEVAQFVAGTFGSLTVPVPDGATSLQWTKDGKPVAGATAATLSIPAVSLADGGQYVLNYVQAGGAPGVSSPVAVGVIEFSTEKSVAFVGSQLKLTAKISGPGFSIEWSRNGAALQDATGKILGSHKPELVVKNLAAADAGKYACVFKTPAGAQGIKLTREVSVLNAVASVRGIDLMVDPVAGAGSLGSLILNEESDLFLRGNNQFGTSGFKVAGLPAGMKYDPATGRLAGRPAKAGMYFVTITPPGGGKGVTAQLIVESLPDGAVGTFVSTLPRNSLTGNMGGTLTITVSPLAAVTGKLVIGKDTFNFKGMLTTQAGASPRLVASVARKNSTPLALDVTWNTSTANISATLADGGSTTALTGFKTGGQGQNVNVGRYNARLTPPADASAATVPLGHGFVSLVLERTANISAAGRLPDGTPFTSSTALGTNGEVQIFAMAGSGSVLGTTAPVIGAISGNSTSSFTGNVTWQQSVQAGPLYPAAFGPVTLAVSGKLYTPPAAGSVVLGLLPVASNAKLTFTEAGVASASVSPDLVFTLSTSNAVKLPTANPDKVALTLNPKTGAFSGSFTLSDVSGVNKPRKAPFQGVLVTGQGGRGYFLLPQTPASPGAEPSILSGKVQLGAP